jgi:hypothetical protein
MMRRLINSLIAISSLAVWAGLGPVLPVSLGQEALRDHNYRFGAVEAFYRPDDALELGIGWDRIIFDWAQFQPTGPDDYNTDAVPEEWLVAAQRAGREVVGLLKSTPAWASDEGSIGAVPDGLDLPLDSPRNYWAAFVRRTVSYYSAAWGIRHWIIYNEPDIRPGDLPWHEFDGEVEDYYQVLKTAYLAAKAADSSAIIHLAGMAWYVDVQARRDPYLQRLLAIAWSDLETRKHGFFFDVVMLHSYFGTQHIWDMVDQTRQILRKFGLYEKPIWVDETNARPSRDPFADVPPGVFDVSLTQQADYIVQAAALGLAAGVERFGVYRLYDNHYSPGLTEPWGLVRGDGSRRPAFEAYRTVINLFSETEQATRFYTDNATVIALEYDGRTVYVMWARDIRPVKFNVMAQEKTETAVVMNIYGATREIEPQTVAKVKGDWFVVETPGAVADGDGLVMVEGSPSILILPGPPRALWVDVLGNWWTLN